MDVFSIIVLIGFIGACLLAARIGARYRPGDWYERLAKPRWRPPNWLFPPAWAVLYLTIAVSGWLVWRTSGFAGAALPLAIYFVQLVLNAAWSPIFFGMRRPDLAFVEIAILWCSIVATIATFQPFNAIAAWLLLPYLAWVTFAAALNFTIWRMNRGSILQGQQDSGSNPETRTEAQMLEEWSRMMRQKRTFFPILFLIFGGMASPAQTQTADPAAGEVYAEKVCAQCHAIHPSGLSPELTAPPFRDVANTPGMTDTALRVWLSTSHPTMPNIVVEPQDMDNVIAYILTLKDKPQ